MHYLWSYVNNFTTEIDVAFPVICFSHHLC